jgi:hypothetical protein
MYLLLDACCGKALVGVAERAGVITSFELP